MEQAKPDENKFWASVRENPADFNSWTFLLQTVDQRDIEAIREAYNAFLTEYPLCYVYWKKYADFEQTRGDQNTVRIIYERGLAAIPYSVDLWVHYCDYLIEKSTDPAETRSVFERAAAYVGTDYLSSRFWDKYLEFEMANKEFTRVTELFVRLLGSPISDVNKYYDRWRTFAGTRPIMELLTAEERAEWGEEEEAVKKEKMNAAREQLFNHTTEQLARRQPYEQVIKDRPYFHVKPLMENELKTWHSYLTFEEKEGDRVRTMKLYERCLVACCNYPEFWRRYCSFLETEVGVDQARSVWVRATTVFLKRRPDVHLDYALFEEAQGETEKVKEIYAHVLSLAPGHVESIIRWAEFNRRQGVIQAACKILSDAIASPKLETASAFLAMNLARLQERFLGDVEGARATYQEAIARTPDNKNIWLAAVNFETLHINDNSAEKSQEGNEGVNRVLELYSRAVHEDSRLSKEDRVELWRNYIDFAHSFLNNPPRIHQLKAEFYKAFPRGKVLDSKKRPLEQGSQSKIQTKQAKTSETATAGSTAVPMASPSLLPTPPVQMTQLPTPVPATPQYAMPAQGYGAMYGQYGGYPGYGAYPATAAPTTTAGVGWPMQQPTTVYPGVQGAPPAGGQYGAVGYSPYQQAPYGMDGSY